jgi:signal transduction histidine kinase
VIASGLQLMDSDPALAPEQRTRLARAQAAAAQMQALVEGLLFLSRGEELGRGTAAFSVGGLLHEAVRTLTVAAGRRAPAISLSIAQDYEVSVPRGLLLCVVNNLLRNALDHSRSRRIDIVLEGPELVIQDYGRGIDAPAQAQVFEPDMRGPDSHGEGVGLNLVKRICDRLGWRIALESASGAGARFTLKLS